MHIFIKAALIMLASLWLASTFAGDTQPVEVFDLHFAVITKNPAAQRVASLHQLHTEVEILNTYFVTEDRKPIVKFRFKSATFYNEIMNSSCEFVALGDTGIPTHDDRLARLFNTCNDPKVRDPRAINFYVYDSHDSKKGASDTTGHGRNNSNRPFVLLDWERLDHKDQSPEEHEMGHAFGLGHECVPGATQRSSTNIMTSAECGRGSGGLRNIGFNPAQIRTILANAKKIRERLAGKQTQGGHVLQSLNKGGRVPMQTAGGGGNGPPP